MGSVGGRDVVVVGCGVIGLTSARRLQGAGHRVRIVARELPGETTSARAAAVWLPFQAEPRERIAAWAEATYRECRRSAGEVGTGVRFVPLTRVSRRSLERPLWLREGMPFRRFAEGGEPLVGLEGGLPEGYSHAWQAEVPFFDAPRFLGRLLHDFEAAGGEVMVREVEDLAEAAKVGGLGEDGVVVHCAGLGARETVGDESMYPIRGQLVVARSSVAPGHRVDDDDEAAPAYVLPRGRDEVILGGTAEVGDGRCEPDPAEREAILERCRRLLAPPAEDGSLHSLADLEIVASVVGLRPGRPAVRLEVERDAAGGRPVIHNYGHGGSGFTVCWGCADEVVARMEEL